MQGANTTAFIINIFVSLHSLTSCAVIIINVTITSLSHFVNIALFSWTIVVFFCTTRFIKYLCMMTLSSTMSVVSDKMYIIANINTHISFSFFVCSSWRWQITLSFIITFVVTVSHICNVLYTTSHGEKVRNAQNEQTRKHIKLTTSNTLLQMYRSRPNSAANICYVYILINHPFITLWLVN